MSALPEERPLPLIPTEPAPQPLVDCWRCGKSIAAIEPICPHCRAPNRTQIRATSPSAAGLDSLGTAASPASRFTPVAHGDDEQRLMRVLWIFLILLATSVIQGVTGRIMAESIKDDRAVLRSAQSLIYVVMAVDTVIVFFALASFVPPPRRFPVASRRFLPGLLWSLVALAIALALNVAYHALLLWYLQVPEWLVIDPLEGANVWLLVAICVQPAIVEELFFRFLVLDTLRGLMRTNSAVWVSSMMFAVAHLGIPLSMPVLMIVGLALGYARILSGSLWLPMLLHAIHNAVVIWMETQT